MRRLIVLGIALSISAAANAQNKNHFEQERCKVRFAAYQSNPHVPGGMIQGMSKEQAKWYGKNKKNYSSVCLDGDNPDYVVVWSSRFSAEGEPEPIIFSGPTSGVAQSLESERVFLSIFRTADVKRAQDDRSYQPKPVYYTRRESWWTYRKLHHMVIDDAMKFLAEKAVNGDPPQSSSASLPEVVRSELAGTVIVTSAPGGADVYADDAFVGNTPATLKLSPGKHSIRVAMEGYNGWNRELTVQSGSEVNLKAALEKQN